MGAIFGECVGQFRPAQGLVDSLIYTRYSQAVQAGGSGRPDSLVECFQHAWQLAVEALVKALEANAVTLENQVGMVLRRAVPQLVGLGLRRFAFEPVALWRRMR